uniref:Uncharacterized protein n=1 Tax=Arundo donax TaxID=35708 RepID=A0A0A9B9X3_ARUDO
MGCARPGGFRRLLCLWESRCGVCLGVRPTRLPITAWPMRSAGWVMLAWLVR